MYWNSDSEYNCERPKNIDFKVTVGIANSFESGNFVAFNVDGLFCLTKEDAIISDALNHASIIDGVRLCKAQRYRYLHNDMDDLEKQLKAASVWQSTRKYLLRDMSRS